MREDRCVALSTMSSDRCLGRPGLPRLGGLTTGLLKGREEDQAGISVAHAIVDQPNLPLGVPAAKSTETAVELTYRLQAKDWVTLQPDLQYVIRPNGDRTIGNALVIGLRLNINLTRNLIRQVKGEVP